MSCSCGTGFRKDAHDRGQDPEADPDVSCKSEEILVITFTKYAAVEMKNRFFSAMKGTRPAVTFGTFHGIYYGDFKWAYRFGPENILSEEEKRQMLLQIVNRKEIDEFEEEDFLKENYF